MDTNSSDSVDPESGPTGQEFFLLRDILDGYLVNPQQLAQSRGNAPTFIPTGFFDLDKLLGGLQRSNLVVVAARPSVGKTSLALNIACHAGRVGGAHTAIFSLQISKEELADRLISTISRIDTYKLRQFRLGQDSGVEEVALMTAIGGFPRCRSGSTIRR